MRLTDVGYELGMISEERYARFNEKRQQIQDEIQRLTDIRIKPNEHTQSVIEANGGSRLKDGILAIDALRRPEMTYNTILEILKKVINYLKRLKNKLKFKRNMKVISINHCNKLKKLNAWKRKIPEDLDYSKVDSLATEAREKLAEVKPLNIAQASRISGVNPADISILLVYLEQGKLQRVKINERHRMAS